ncbi:MAG: hypothetical protein HOE90_06345 [Bacteriovoracaceae bacterium]|nr:hypothetical protein [Bacteriovoracaceae bacterium]
MKKLILFVFLFTIKAYSQTANCIHYFVDGDQLIESGKTVGVDIGPSKYIKGLYKCKIEVKSSDIDQGKFLYIGEVGDSSLIEFTHFNQMPIRNTHFTHGLYRSKEVKPDYMRIIPFFLDLKSFYTEAGEYSFTLHYQDILPRQTGIRSGSPRILNFKNLIISVIKNSTNITYFIFEIFLFIGFIYFSLFLVSGVSLFEKLQITITLSLCIGTFISLTAIPRMFISMPLVARINDSIQTTMYAFFLISISKHFTGKIFEKFKIDKILFSVIILSSFFIFFSSKREITTLGICAGFSITVFYSSILILIHLKKIQYKHFHSLPRHISALLALGAISFTFDVINLFLLKSKYYYTNHYIGILAIATLILSLYNQRYKNRNDLLKQLSSLDALVSNDMEPLHFLGNNAIDNFAEKIASIVRANRVSISQVKKGKIILLGTYGSFIEKSKNTILVESELLNEAFNERKTIRGSLGEPSQEYIIYPLIINGTVVSLLCITYFQSQRLSPFIEPFMKKICRVTLNASNIIISKKKEISDAELITSLRLGVHEIQIKSEDYFREHFQMSENFGSNCVIKGDLVLSSTLNDVFGADIIDLALDSWIHDFWSRHKELGIIINRVHGDEIAFVIPCLYEDEDESLATQRGLIILNALSKHEEELSKYCKDFSIHMPMQFRFVMNSMTNVHRFKGQIRAVNQVSDGAIDRLARVLNSIAGNGECLLLEDAYKYIQDKSTLLELKPRRLRGMVNNIRIFTVNDTSSKKVSNF